MIFFRAKMLFPILALLLCHAARGDEPGAAETLSGRWSAEKARQWYDAQPWLVGCNFVPASACNDVEMWQAETFDLPGIDRELGYAEDLGFNTVRIFINYVVWEADPKGLKKRLDQFLAAAEKHGIRAMPILFDDCFHPEPKVGKQEDLEPGIHNNRWVQSPGVSRRGDKTQWPKFKQYVQDVVGTFAADDRIVVWDLYNEPTAGMDCGLVEATFQWAREMNPSQPLTTCVYGSPESARRIAELSDVVSFHHYGPLPGLQATVESLRRDYDRPLLCTEWMARTLGSLFATHLPYFQREKIACWNWGLVNGRTQTHFPWGSPPNAPEPAVWFHDILRGDGTPYRAAEVRMIRRITGRAGAAEPVWILPASDQQGATWRFTLEKPVDDWMKSGFDDAAWQQGPAPFGREEEPFARQPNTVWNTGEIWLRRTFDAPAVEAADYALSLHHDEDAEVYIDGVLAIEAKGYNAAYEELDISPEAEAILRTPGRHEIAVHCRQTSGGQYIDLGILAYPAEGASR